MSTESRKLKVLVSAYACEPNRGSEPDIGWQWVLAYSKDVSVWALTRANNRGVIEKYENENGSTGVHWIWVDAASWVLKLKKRTGRLGILAYYWYWQFLAAKAAKAIEKEVGQFDWCHQLTLNGFREPGRLDCLKSPIVWGPIGGLQNSDWGLSRLRGLRPALIELARTIVNNATKRFGIRAIWAVKRRALVLGINGDSMDWIQTWRTAPATQLLEIGMPQVPAKPEQKQSSLKILWAGNDESRKNPEFAILAWNELRKTHADVHLTMVGLSEGRQKELHRWARKRGVDCNSGLSMHSWVTINELAGFYASAGQFWFTSYRDSSGTVLLWAGAYGVPCIAFNHQGAAVMLSENRGVLIDGKTINEKVKNWCCAAQKICDGTVEWVNHDYSTAKFVWTEKPAFVFEHFKSVRPTHSFEETR